MGFSLGRMVHSTNFHRSLAALPAMIPLLVTLEDFWHTASVGCISSVSLEALGLVFLPALKSGALGVRAVLFLSQLGTYYKKADSERVTYDEVTIRY